TAQSASLGNAFLLAPLPSGATTQTVEVQSAAPQVLANGGPVPAPSPPPPGKVPPTAMPKAKSDEAAHAVLNKERRSMESKLQPLVKLDAIQFVSLERR